MDRVGDWFQTYTGKVAYAIDPRTEDIDIRDIAHALACICRFGGHSRQFYTVAQHSVLVSVTCHPDFALIGLLHDAAEAYLGDVIRPLKLELPDYRRIEKRWEACIGECFGIGSSLAVLPDNVKQADLCLLATERRDVLGPGPGHDRWSLKMPAPLPERILAWDRRHAEEMFLHRFNSLTDKEIEPYAFR
jgi:5'-deoxynucleotidase YfbR-like HD superfamily hydrolase